MSNVEFGKWLKAQREKKHLSQTQLANALGVHSGHISNIEAGNRGVGVELLIKIADYFHYDVEEIARMATGFKSIRKSLSDEIVKRAESIIKGYKLRETRQRALDYLEYLATQEDKSANETSQEKTATTKTT